MIMEQSFDILTTVVSGTAVFLLVVTAIHASARLLQMTFGKKSGLNRKDTKPENHPDLLYLYSDDPLAHWCMTVRHKNSRLTPIERRFIDLASAVFSGKEPV